MSRYFYFCVLITIILAFPSISLPEEKTFSGAGDGTSWSDGNNWFPTDVPTLSSDVYIDIENGAVIANKTFKARSITVGGRESSRLTSNDFIYGLVDPGENSSISILNRLKGTIVLKGSGVLTLKGTYKSSKESLTPEPSFLFWIK